MVLSLGVSISAEVRQYLAAHMPVQQRAVRLVHVGQQPTNPRHPNRQGALIFGISHTDVPCSGELSALWSNWSQLGL